MKIVRRAVAARPGREILAASLVVLLAITGCGDEQTDEDAAAGPVSVSTASAGAADCPDANPRRNAYFGDLHVHTAISTDA